ncbi:MAG: dihydrolipoamide acetyltransferase family protein [Candidatus Bathyarchaeia archaeon]
MPVIVFPRVDPVMTEGIIAEWLKREGDTVQVDEVIAIAEGEKTTFEVRSPYAGRITKILCKAGEVVKVGQPICQIEGVEEKAPAIERAEKPAPVEIKASPLAKKLAAQLGISLEEIRGTGPEGRITKEDVLLAARERGIAIPEAEAEAKPVERKVPFAGIRKAIAQRLSAGFHEALPVALTTKFAADKLVKHRMETGGSFTAYAVKAVALALQKHKNLNVTLEGGELVYHEEVNIAVAVDTPKGLMAPVIRGADRLSIQELTRRINDFQEKGLRGEITLEEQSNHNFTVTNLGALGIQYFTPIINPPDPAILAFGSIETEPYITEDGRIEPRKVGYLTLVFDHRVVDGAPAAKFLAAIREFLENPETMETSQS